MAHFAGCRAIEAYYVAIAELINTVLTNSKIVKHRETIEIWLR